MHQPLYDLRPNIESFHSAMGNVLPRGRSFVHWPSGRPFDSFSYAVEGRAIYDFGDYQVEAKAGDLVFLPRGGVHNIHILERYHIVFANFFLAMPSGAELRAEKVTPNGGANIEHKLRKILAAWQMQPPTMNTDCLSLLYSIYSDYLNAEHSSYLPSQKKYHMEQAIAYIDKHLDEEDLCVEKIAEAMKMSASHFRHTFKEIHDISPARYIALKRIQIAKRLLNSENFTSVKEVAHKVGYSSIYYFSNAFKKEVKCSPSEWRKKRQIKV